MCFGGDDSPPPQTVNQVNQIPEWASRGGEANFELAKQIGARPYPSYDKPRLAGFSGDTTKAFDMVRSSSGSWIPEFAAATGAAGKVAGASLPGTDLKPYMNPYMGAVTDEIARQGAISRRQIGQAAASRGARDSARHGILEGEQLRGENDAIARTMAGAFTNAQQAALADRQSQLQGADMLAKIGAGKQTLTLQDIQAMLGIGGAQQQQEQQGLDLQREDFVNQVQWPVENLNLRTATLSGTPLSSTRLQTTAGGAAPNSGAQNLGAFASLIGAAALAGGKSGFGWWGK
jgi:hypothetical protein